MAVQTTARSSVLPFRITQRNAPHATAWPGFPVAVKGRGRHVCRSHGPNDASGDGATRAIRVFGRSRAYLPSQALTLSGLASTHFLAAASGVILSAVMYFATRFWSSLVQLKFLISAAAGEPELASLLDMILFRL